MTVESLLDLYVYSWGLFLFELMWDVLSASGLIYIAFIKIYGSYFKKVNESASEDWDAKSAQPSVEIATYSLIAIIILCMVPMVPIKVTDIRVVDRQCLAGSAMTQRESLSSKASESQTGQSVKDQVDVMFAGKQIHQTIAMAFTMWLGEALKDLVIEDLPCQTNVQAFRSKILTENISNPALIEEVQDFSRYCYRPAMQKANRLQLVDESMVWPGAQPFFNDPRFYRNADKDGFYSQRPIQRFSDKTEFTPEAKEVAEAVGGYPSCYDWWNGDSDYGEELDDDRGLAGLLYSQLDESLRESIQQEDLAAKLNTGLESGFTGRPASDSEPDIFYGGDMVTNKHRLLFQALFSPLKKNIMDAPVVADYSVSDRSDTGFGDLAGMTAGYIGLSSKVLSEGAGATMMQYAAPFIKPIIVMVFLFLAPLVMCLGMYKGSVVMTVHVAILSVIIWPIYWTVARILEESIRSALGLAFLSTDNMLLQFTTWSLFVLLPLMATALIGWAGFSVGAGIQDFASKGVMSTAGSAGKKGGDAIKDNVKKAGKKG